MAYGKKITLFLKNGSTDGRISCELSNWNGKAYRIPKNRIRECADLQDLDNAGIYILFGKSDNTDREGLAYIGEADEIRKRLSQHLVRKDFWNETIVFISKDRNLNKAHIKYIESKLYEAANEVGRYKLENSNKPTQSTISEPDIAEMEEFIANIKLLVGTLGFKIFDPLVSPYNTESTDKLLFIHSSRRGAEARGIVTSEGFVVLKGSKMAKSVTKSCIHNYILLRDKLLTEKTVISDHEELLFDKDTLFSSPSTAASIVVGRNANGLTEWKTKDGVILKELNTK